MMRNMYRMVAAAVAMAMCLATLTGCGPNDGKSLVSGSVSYDKTPIVDGIISFQPKDGRAIESIAIQNGKYSLRLPAGEMMVKILGNRAPTAEEIASRKKDPMWSDGMTSIDQPIQCIPAIYNANSTLATEIPEGGKRDLNFDLEAP